MKMLTTKMRTCAFLQFITFHQMDRKCFHQDIITAYFAISLLLLEDMMSNENSSTSTNAPVFSKAATNVSVNDVTLHI